MTSLPSIGIEKIDYGPYPLASRLNPRLSTTAPLMLATIDIGWKPKDPCSEVAALEASMLSFSPRFGKHQCRGAEQYHVFRGDGPGRCGGPIEAGLALAHLIEHAVIDFQCAITGERRCSGVTAAHRGRDGKFDLMVECNDPRVGSCSLALALAWLTSALAGTPPGTPERDVLEVARLAWRRSDAPLNAARVAREASWTPERGARALAALREIGYLKESRYAVNLSGLPEYRLAESGISPRE